jgi:hypothetical protein
MSCNSHCYFRGCSSRILAAVHRYRPALAGPPHCSAPDTSNMEAQVVAPDKVAERVGLATTNRCRTLVACLEFVVFLKSCE